MNDLKQALREGYPLDQEPRLSAADAQRMRAIVLAAAAHSSRSQDWWPQPLVVVTTLMLASGAGIMFGRRLPPPVDTTSRAVDTAPPVRRQLQFETKGGTRVIWVLNPELNLGKEPLP